MNLKKWFNALLDKPVTPRLALIMIVIVSIVIGFVVGLIAYLLMGIHKLALPIIIGYLVMNFAIKMYRKRYNI